MPASADRLPTSFERFEMEELRRTALKGAPYNPRTLSPPARRKLKRGLEKMGLLAPIVWNRRSGRVVSGHQRLSCMDDLAKGQDYSLQVAVVDLDEKAEKAANVLLNNPLAQGEWDMERLGALLSTPDLDLDATGFGVDGVFRFFGEAASEVLANARTEELEKAAEEFSAQVDGFKAAANKGTYKGGRNSPEFYFLAIFRTQLERDAWLREQGLEEDRYQDGTKLPRAAGEGV